MDAFRKGDHKLGHQLQDQFLAEIHASVKDHCPCPAKCSHHGKCVDCVTIHRGHQDHLPYCFHAMVNDRVELLLGLTEQQLKRA